MSKTSRERELARRSGAPYPGSREEVAKRQAQYAHEMAEYARTPAGRKASGLLLAVSALAAGR